ncbi:MAG TPA: hypothetical protein VMD25_13675 [Acidobacteriaceae bacterium]|nr:hypothetical protein [Acidobacteriaceae bacterium]
MNRRFTLSPLVILGLVNFLILGELVSGTGLYFVGMMAIAVLSICLTYNLLGGLGTIGGIAFTSLALNSIVISQFAKVAMFEAADLNLRNPDLTITVYAVFYLSLLAGTFLFGWIRVRLPRPLEPTSSSHSNALYIVSLVVGFIATFALAAAALAGRKAQESIGHGFSRAFSYLLLFSLVLAVDQRIRDTEGRHCFGWAALWPSLAIAAFGFLGASRQGFVEAPLIVTVTCYLRGYKFRRKHYLAGVAFVAVLFLIVSPYYLWSRSWRNQEHSVGSELSVMTNLLVSAPSQWESIRETVLSEMSQSSENGGEYYSRAGTVTLNRLALIAPDSALIDACSRGFHYGWPVVESDLLSGFPHFLRRGTTVPIEGAWYRASIAGLQSSDEENVFISMTGIADSYGAFGWVSVIFFPLLVIPAVFVVYDSMFDLSRPWGTVAVVTLIFEFIVASMGAMISSVLIMTPVYLLAISWFIGRIAGVFSLGSGRAPGAQGLFASRQLNVGRSLLKG